MESLPKNNENVLESISQFVDIEFDSEGKPQKFVEMFDEEGNTYIASYPTTKDINFHIKVLLKGAEKLREKGIKVFHGGGGILRLAGDKLYVGGKSKQLGDFKKEGVFNVFKNAYPTLEIIEE